MAAYLPNDVYKLVTDSVPIVCIDVLPIRLVNDSWQIGIITRATGNETGKPALIGGRIEHNESITQAIARHLKHDLNLSSFNFYKANVSSRPFYVQQYWHGSSAQPPFGYDTTKNSISLTYLIEIDSEPEPANEARDFTWISLNELPEKAAFNHHLLMKLAFEELSKS